jgi:hypothetical protein
MRAPIFVLFSIILLAAVLSGCGGATTTTPNSNAVNATTANKTNSNNPLETTKKEPEGVTNNAPTLTPVFKAYCEAKIKGDEAGLRKVYSQGTLKHFEEGMKKEKIKTLVQYLELDKVTPKLCEINNEKITGDRATARIKFESAPNGIEVVFVKENGEWKMTDESPTFDAVKSSNSNTTKAK